MSSECSLCNLLFQNDQLYQCTKCLEKQDNTATLELKCELCIVPHIRKHIQNVVDSKGNKPAVCGEHQQLRLEYCKTCDISCCSKCLNTHSKHEFQSLYEKNKELITSIHEVLTDLETEKEKPLRRKTEEVSALVDKKRKEITDLKQQNANELNLIQEKAYEILEMKQKGIEKELLDLQGNVDELGQMQEKCRTLLSMSTAFIINDFPAF